MENEEKNVKSPKKKNGLFTLFACLMTAIIVVLAMNIGDKLSKVVNPETRSNSSEEKSTPILEIKKSLKDENWLQENINSYKYAKFIRIADIDDMPAFIVISDVTTDCASTMTDCIGGNSFFVALVTYKDNKVAVVSEVYTGDYKDAFVDVKENMFVLGDYNKVKSTGDGELILVNRITSNKFERVSECKYNPVDKKYYYYVGGQNVSFGTFIKDSLNLSKIENDLTTQNVDSIVK